MDIELSPKSAKYLIKLDNITKQRIKSALIKLAQEPPQGDIKKLQGKDGYRLRIGKYRALFDIADNKIIVYDIDSRGQVYK
ncbi:MAG TPA: type II toxin-antitoxin system RelE/ParE family toxin [Candidatus Monoglobus merdigallinarum]|uniref:Type II toxin-antitoxin system RelE/ParE family toxin n=1 Tax=Candidatus Monoglobus merdigallinarum TaxID=2838698 RepID=A0A9D1PQE3_9FIRM|nr:type II toxin-antitoxin system RelE/ParE family toxin [Candidatus Monoglobus merdigallinarum]